MPEQKNKTPQCAITGCPEEASLARPLCWPHWKLATFAQREAVTVAWEARLDALRRLQEGRSADAYDAAVEWHGRVVREVVATLEGRRREGVA